MARFHLLEPHSPSGLLLHRAVDRVAERLLDGGLAVLPTETGYLLAALATSMPALRRAFALKQRALTHPMHVACSSVAMADAYAVLSPAARRLLGAYTPGPLTVVVPQTSALPDSLVTLDGTVGIRIPDHPATLQVVAAVGAPVTATSLNRSGEESRPVNAEMLDSFDWDEPDGVPVVVDNASIRCTAASTLVRCTGADVEILRAGPVSRAQIDETLAAQPTG